MLVCLIPMLSVAMVECRIFSYFLLLKERLYILNRTIDFYRNNLHSSENRESHNSAHAVKMSCTSSKIFFIAELVGSKKINGQVNVKTSSHVNATGSNFVEKLKSMSTDWWGFIKSLLNIRLNRIFADDFEAYESRMMTNNYAERVSGMQIIYSKLYELSDLISKAYGIQIIAIISVQFITLTTILYYCVMKIIRWEF